MDKDKIKELVNNYDRDVDHVLGAIVYNIKTGEIIVSTYKDRKTAEAAVKVEQMIENLKHELDKIQPESRINWGMSSFERAIYTSLRIRGDIFIAIEFDAKKSPTDAIEDLLELGLDLGHYL